MASFYNHVPIELNEHECIPIEFFRVSYKLRESSHVSIIGIEIKYLRPEMSKTAWRIKVGVFIGTIIILVLWHCNMFEIKWDTYRSIVIFLWSQSAKGECVSQCLYGNPLNTLSHRECVHRLNSRFKRILRTWYKYLKVQKTRYHHIPPGV